MYKITFNTKGGNKIVEHFDTVTAGYMRAAKCGRTVVAVERV